MPQTVVNGLTVYYAPEDQEAARVVCQAVMESTRLLHDRRGLPAPPDCRIYVMASLEDYLRHAPPFAWRVLITLLAPALMPRFRRLWAVAGGWAQRYGRRHTVGVKPPRLMAEADRSLGTQIFIPETTLDEKTRHVTCHELTHAFSAHLRLPVWLHEGLAMVTVDALLGRPTVLPESVRLLAAPEVRLRGYGRLKDQRQREGLVRLYARAYWLTRYLDAHHPALLREWLARRHSRRAIENGLAAALDVPRATLWPEVDALLVREYGQ